MTGRPAILITDEQAAALGRLAQGLLDVSVVPAVELWLKDEGFPDNGRYQTAALMTFLDALAFMIIATNLAPENRLAAAREHCRNLRTNIRHYHRDTGR